MGWLTKTALSSESLEWRQAVAEDKQAGYSFVEKFGQNDDIGAGVKETIWDGSDQYLYPTVARQHNIVSTSSLDTNGGTGVNTVEVQGLDANYLEISETITMNGITPVLTTNSYIRIFRMVSRIVGTSYVNQGDITATSQTELQVNAMIKATNGQTQMAIYTVPANKTGYLYRWYGTLLRASGVNAVAVDIDIFRRNFGESFRSTQPVGTQNTGSGHWQYDYPIPIVLAPKSDIEITAEPTAIAAITGGFTILLKDN